MNARAWPLALVVVFGAAFPATDNAHAAHACPLADVHAARGVVKAFGPDRKTVTIAHEAIPGFMAAMTMSFEAASPEQVRDLAVGDQVRFAFEVTAEGRRLLVSIAKESPVR